MIFLGDGVPVYQSVLKELLSIPHYYSSCCIDLKIILYLLVVTVLFLIVPALPEPYAIFLGDGVPVYQSVLKELLSIPHYYAPCHVARQRAGAVGALALKQLADKKTVSGSVPPLRYPKNHNTHKVYYLFLLSDKDFLDKLLLF